MKIGILSEIIMNIEISVEGKFEPLGTNQGHVVTSFSSHGMELALKLSSDNEVLFFSSIGPPSYIKRALKKHNINTDYMSYNYGGFGAHIDFGRPDGRETCVWSMVSIERAVKLIEMFEAEIFEDLNAMVITDIFEAEKVVKLCKKHKVPVFWLANEEDLNNTDDEDRKLIKDIEIINLNNYANVLERI